MTSYWGVIRNGKIEPQEPALLPEGAPVLVTVLKDEDLSFWQKLSEESLKSVWDNSEDNVYAELL